LTNAPDAVARHRLKLGLDWAERAFAVALFALLTFSFVSSRHFAIPDLAVLATEGLVTVLMVTRRATDDVSTRPADWLVAFVGVCAPMLVRPTGHAIGPDLLPRVLVLWGVVFSFWGQLALWRSFGLVAANRGVVRRGPYVFVRHPIYSGYIFTYAGFLLLHPAPWNIAVELLAVLMMVIRILAEERVLSADPAYLELKSRVRYRLIPGVF
jgi:protein-S-isoprenylcysteine O-methyltransferase Ste14